MNVLSLFDGMSCGQIALNRGGIKYKNYFASEVDRYAIRVTQANYPKTIQLGDVREVTANDLLKIDLLLGGSPCQGFSFAGKQLNFEDPRSKLFFEYVRLLEECQPKYFLLENVKMSQKSQDAISAISAILGVDPIIINSSLVSAQNRVRLYWTNIPNICQPQDKGICLVDILEHGFVDREKSYCLDANYFKGGNLRQYYEKSRRQLVFLDDPREYSDLSNTGISGKVYYRKLTPLECERLQTVPDGYTDHVSNTQRYKMLGNGWTVDVVAHILKTLNFNT